MTLLEGVRGEVSRPFTSEFLKKKKSSVYIGFLLFSKHILTERALLREKNDIKDTAKKEKMQKRSLVFGIYCQCSLFSPLVFRAVTYDITRLDYTVQILSKAGSEIHV